MSDEAALLAAILAHPEEDTPRLVYADWLDEQGGVSNTDRAEYIRLEINFAREFPERRWSKAKAEAQKRARQLFAKHCRDWFPELYGRKNILRGGRGYPDMARGFPYRLLCESAKLLEVGERLMQLAPITEVEFRSFDDGDLRRLVRAPWVQGFRDLNLSGYSNAPDWTPLADCPYFRELTEIVPYGGYLNKAGAARIAAANPFPKLRRFSVTMSIDAVALATLFGGPAFTGLRELRLSDTQSSGPIPGVKGVCESAALASLKVFEMRWHPTRGLTAMLTSSTFWPGLEELDLLRNNLGNDDLARMLNTPSKLRRLELDDNKITSKGAKLLAEHPALENVTVLDLSRNAIGDAGVAALVNSPRARNLQKLEISTCGFGLKGVTAIVESPNLANLRQLFMHSNALDLKGARLLAAAPQLAKLDWLYIGGGLTATAKKVLKERFGDRVSL
jgi:uncharacterized protein (TIGR02996 family)